jgi:hypothetical protein
MGNENPLLLEATRVTINLHPKTEYKNLGPLDRNEFYSYVPVKMSQSSLFPIVGVCFPRYNKGIISVYVTQLAGQREKEAVTTLGHEETHAMQYLAQLNRFYSETKKRGLEYAFLDGEYVEKSDYHVLRILNGEEQDEDRNFFTNQENLDFNEYLRREIIAYLGGHIAFENKFPNEKEYIEKSLAGLKICEKNWLKRISKTSIHKP